MKRIMILTGALAMVAALGTFDSSAKASDFALHIGGRGYHVDIGRPHYRTAYYGGYGPSNCYGGPRRVWHDTTHLDYHPGEFVRHRGHYHYVPGHYDVHETGHWHHGW